MVHSVGPEEARKLVLEEGWELVDVRESHEWSAGHIRGAHHVPLDQVRRDPKSALFRDRVIFVCAAGVRSETAARIALSNGLSEVLNLRGGTRLWAKLGLPLVAESHELAVAV